MNYDAWKIWIDIMQFVLTGAIGVYIHLVSKNEATNRRMLENETRTDARLDDHGVRIAKLEGAKLPNHEDMNRITTALNALSRETSEQTGTLASLTKQVSLIQQWLYDKAK